MKRKPGKEFSNSVQLAQTAFDAIEGVFYVKDTEGVLQYVNKQMALVCGVDRDELIGKKDNDIFPPEVATQIHNNDQQIIRSKQAKMFEESMRLDRHEAMYRINKVPLCDNNGDVYGICGIGFDIRDQKEYEKEQNVLLEKLDAKNKTHDRLLSILAHEFRAPFSSLLLFLESLSDDDLDDREKAIIIQELYKSSLSINLLIENLLTWTIDQKKYGTINKKILDVKTLFEQCAASYMILAKKKDITIQQNIPEKIYINADENCLCIILTNLINNAIKFTPEFGSITTSAYTEGNDTIITISDTGIGMSESIMKRIFDINDHISSVGTNNEKGYGMGLGLSHELVARNCGKIWVESVIGEGTTFYVSLPAGSGDVGG